MHIYMRKKWTKDPIEIVGNETAIPASPAPGNVNKEHATIVGVEATETGWDVFRLKLLENDLSPLVPNEIWLDQTPHATSIGSGRRGQLI